MLLKQNVFYHIIVVIFSVEYFTESNGYHLISLPYKNLTRSKRQSGCRNRQYSCDNGECIPIYKFCDGKVDCIDRSDEISDCNINGCLSNQFQCKYGACTYGNVKCNGEQDCWDNSDEDVKLCNKITAQSVRCPPRQSKAIFIYCILNGIEQDCSKDVPEGTISFMSCKPNYIDKTDGPTEATCLNGTWTTPVKNCTPECNHIVSEGQPFIVNGFSAQRGEVPWHVGIYKQAKDGSLHYICGGSIISTKVVLSAAHCFAREDYGHLYPLHEFSLAAGKIYNKWDASEDKEFVQKRQILNIHIPEKKYFGRINYYYADIAVVVVDKLFTFSNFVNAVCVDWNFEYTQQHLKDGAKGKVAGWGYNLEGTLGPSTHLKYLTVPFVEYNKCVDVLPYNFIGHLTSDKFCAGYTNGSSACNGDSGGGLVFANKIDSTNKYYVQGIVSVAPKTDGICDNSQLTLYTKVSDYILFLKKNEESNRGYDDCDAPPILNEKIRISDIKCNSTNRLPTKSDTPSSPNSGECPALVIENGKYELRGATNYVLGNPIPNYSILFFTCNSEVYTLTSPNNELYCINGEFDKEIPKCTRSCSPIFFSSADLKCELNGIKFDCSKKVPEGTIATIRCKPHYVQIIPGSSTLICMAGSWDTTTIKCIPECGDLVPETPTLIINGQGTQKGHFPFHVGIYKKLENIEYICGGSIISEKVVLSAAHCFSQDLNGQLYSISEFLVAAGKYFSQYDAPEDAVFVQKRNVLNIEFPSSIYHGSSSNYAGDIAIVIVDEPFTFSNFIKPVCVDWDSAYVNVHLRNGTMAKVASWGTTSIKNPSASVDLKQLSVPYIDRSQCLEIVPSNFIQFVTLDKFCAGYTNGSSICNGDGGSGLVFPHEEYGKKKYFIQGIASIGPTKESSCDNNQLGMYTKVQQYINDIKALVARTGTDPGVGGVHDPPKRGLLNLPTRLPL